MTSCAVDTPVSSPHLDMNDVEMLANREAFDQTLIFFDWDDTLMSSTYLASQGFRVDGPFNPSDEMRSQLRQLETAVLALLKQAMQYGTVVIVTNAETGWVQLSAQKWMPGVVGILDKIRIFSARSTFEPHYPNCPAAWKYQAFCEGVEVHYADKDRSHINLISLGDSHVEREAILSVGGGLEGAITKSVKFVEQPTIDQLRRELELVARNFSYIIGHDSGLDLMLSITLIGDGKREEN